MKTSRHLLLAVGLCVCWPVTLHAQPAKPQAPASADIVARAKALSAQKKFPDARKLLEDKLAQNPTPAQRTRWQNALADVHFAWGDVLMEAKSYAWALRHYQAARESDARWRPRRVKNDLAAMGLTYVYLEKYEDSLKCSRLAATAFHESKDQSDEALALRRVALACRRLGRLDESLSTYQEARRIRRAIKDSEGELDVMGRIVDMYVQLGQYDKAFSLGHEALSLAEKLKLPDAQASALANIGFIYKYMRNMGPTLVYLNKALILFRQTGNRSGEASMLGNIGACQPTSLKALPYFQRILPIYGEMGDVDGQMRTLRDMGSIYNDLGDLKKAMSYLNRCMYLSKKYNITWGNSFILQEQAHIYLKLGRYDEAITNLNSTLKSHRDGNNWEGVAIVLNELSHLAASRGRLDEAILYGKQVVNIYQTLRLKNQKLEGSLRRLYLADIRDKYEILATWLMKQNRLEEAEQVLRFLRQDDVFEFVRRDPQLAKELAGLFHPLVYTPTEKAQLAIQGVKIADSEVGQGSEESRSWQGELAAQQIAGRGRAALLSTFNSGDTFYLILTTSNERRVFPVPIKKSQFDALSARLQRALSNRNFDPRPDARQMYDIVFAGGKLEQALQEQNIKTALWFPSGSLRSIPIDALYDGTQYLLQKERANVYVTLKSKNLFDATSKGEALAVGVSQRHMVEDQAKGQKGLIFEPLPNVPKEVRAIVSDPADGGTGPFPGTILLDKKATLPNLKSGLAKGISILHIATHFVLVSTDERGSFFLMGDGTRLPISQWKEALKLDGVGLLTLSACDTGVGTSDATGGEVSSIGELSQYLGAQSVVVSLWPVADTSTADLMRDFYTRLHDAPDGGKAEALREAQRALLGNGTPAPAIAAERGRPIQEDGKGGTTFVTDPAHPYAHPFYWAPFSLIGNWK